MDNQLYFEYQLKTLENTPEAPHWEEALNQTHYDHHKYRFHQEDIPYHADEHNYEDWADPDEIIENKHMQKLHRHRMKHEVFNRESEPQEMSPHVTNYSLIEKMKQAWNRTKAPIVEKMSWNLYTQGTNRFLPNVVDTHAILQTIQRSDKDGTILLETNNKTESFFPEHSIKLSRFDQTVKQFQEYVQNTRAVQPENANPSILRQTVGQIQEQLQHTLQNKKIAHEMIHGPRYQEADGSQFQRSVENKAGKKLRMNDEIVGSAMTRTSGSQMLEDTSHSLSLKPIASDRFHPHVPFNSTLSAHMNDQLYETTVKRPMIEKIASQKNNKTADSADSTELADLSSYENRHTPATKILRDNPLLRKIITQPLLDESKVNLHFKSAPIQTVRANREQHDVSFDTNPSFISRIKQPITEAIRKFRGEVHIMSTLQGQQRNLSHSTERLRSKIEDIEYDETIYESDAPNISLIRKGIEPSLSSRRHLHDVEFSHR
jgi:hypothetical protein